MKVLGGISKWLIGSALSAAALTAMAGPAQAQVAREIFFHNDCASPVRFVISHADQSRNWHPHGWWNFSAHQEPTRLLVDDRPITQLDDHDLYFYAEATDGSGNFWDGSDHQATFLGTTFRMQKANMTVESGNLLIRLTCDQD